MSDSARQLAAINARFSEIIPLVSGAGPEDSANLLCHFDEIRALLQQARSLTSSGRLSDADGHTREILADYRHHLVTVRNAIGRLEPLLTARRAELHRQLEHIRSTAAWANSVREVR